VGERVTEGSGRASVIQQAARLMVSSDPTAAFAFTQLVSEADRRMFFRCALRLLADKDTTAAMKWTEQLADAAERDAAIQAIRSIAPVGIGTALGMQDGYPIINQLVPGTPAERSGQLHVGDRIVALAQGDNVFVTFTIFRSQTSFKTSEARPTLWSNSKSCPLALRRIQHRKPFPSCGTRSNSKMKIQPLCIALACHSRRFLSCGNKFQFSQLAVLLLANRALTRHCPGDSPPKPEPRKIILRFPV